MRGCSPSDRGFFLDNPWVLRRGHDLMSYKSRDRGSDGHPAHLWRVVTLSSVWCSRKGPGPATEVSSVVEKGRDVSL